MYLPQIRNTAGASTRNKLPIFLCLASAPLGYGTLLPNLGKEPAWRIRRIPWALLEHCGWGQLFGWSREAHMFVATALARAAKDEANSALADSAGALLVANRGNLEVDPDRALLTMEAFVRTLLEDYDEAIDLLRRYYTNNPHHRAEETRDVHWWWRSIQDDPRYRALRRPAG